MKLQPPWQDLEAMIKADKANAKKSKIKKLRFEAVIKRAARAASPTALRASGRQLGTRLAGDRVLSSRW